MLRLGRCKLDVEVRTLMMIDSLQMTDDDRRIIAEHCRNARESRIVITHGTDTMVETAAALAARRGGQDHRAHRRHGPLQASAVPTACSTWAAPWPSSRRCPPGVYIAMNGRQLAWDRVRKNRDTGVFEEI